MKNSFGSVVIEILSNRQKNLTTLCDRISSNEPSLHTLACYCCATYDQKLFLNMYLDFLSILTKSMFILESNSKHILFILKTTLYSLVIIIYSKLEGNQFPGNLTVGYGQN